MIEIKKINKTYKNKKKSIKASQDLNIKFGHNGLVVFLGKSGSGKTTLLNLIAGILKPDSGEILFYNQYSNESVIEDIDLFRRNNIGYIYQDNNLFDNLTVLENIKLAYLINGKEFNIDEVQTILDKLEIGEYTHSKINDLSGGQKQRVTLARVFLQNTKIILADEPTGSLDYENTNEVMNLIKTESKSKLIIMVSHNIEIANQFADRIITLDQGRIIKDTLVSENKNENQILIEEKTETKRKTKIFPLLKALKYKKKRLFITSLIISITLLLSIFSLNIANFSYAKSLSELMTDYGLTTSSIIKKEYKDGENQNVKLSDDDLEFFKSETVDFSYIYANSKIESGYIKKGTNILESHLVINGISFIDDEMLEKYNYTLEKGSLPNENNEISISSYYAKDLKIDITNLDQYTLIIDSVEYKISGIIDTRIIVDEKLSTYSIYEQVNYTLSGSIFATNKTIETLKRDFRNTYTQAEDGYIGIYMSNDISKIESILNEIDNGYQYEYLNALTKSTEGTKDVIENFKDLIFYGTIVFVSLAVLVFISFIYNELSFNNKNVKILMSLGMSKRNISKLLFVKFLSTLLFIYLINIVIYIVLSNNINNLLLEKHKQILPLLIFDIQSCLLVLFLFITLAYFTININILLFFKNKLNLF